MSRKFILHRVGTQFIETEIPQGRGAHAAAAPSYDNWDAMEQRLLSLGAFPETIKRVKSDFDSGRESTSIEIKGDATVSNELFLAVLPLIHVSNTPYLGYGMTEQTLTLFPDRNFATQFFPDEVESYILAFESRAQKYLAGGHVIGYDVHKEPTGDGRVVVRVVQHVG
ncbi:MAG: hypothetical protein DMG96_14745 [Acidobacteria bacterium]|nr:MAG: hypothetical protein DMG96_14745 [Acidobacteriota bacterium]